MIPDSYKNRNYKRRIYEFSLLFQLSQALDSSGDLNTIIDPILTSMAENIGLRRGTVTILSRITGKISIAASVELSRDEIKRGVYELGEGITGKVVQSGRSEVIRNISLEPLFLDKTGVRQRRKDSSFICVPIKHDSETIGSFSADRILQDEHELTDDVQLLAIVASMISRTVKLRQSNEDKKKELNESSDEEFNPFNMIGKSHSMQEAFNLMAQVSRSETTVFIRGESGTGKELVAQTLHYNSLRAGKPFIKINCSALPESIIESELFGHEKGSFTGAVGSRKGRFELADGGSVFLDEIGELSPVTQVKLLRVLQEREIERVGGNSTIPVDVRIITATNKNVEEEMLKGNFREDLYYRLNVFPICIPPLRDRRSDIMLLTEYFIEKNNRKNRTSVKKISPSAIDLLMNYRWPGNVRELENCIERAVLLSHDQEINASDLPPSLQSAESSHIAHGSTMQATLDSFEQKLLCDALKTTRGNMASAARKLAISERVMGLRVKKYRIDLDKYKSQALLHDRTD